MAPDRVALLEKALYAKWKSDDKKGPKHCDSCINKINNYGRSIKHTAARKYAEKKLREAAKKYYKIKSSSESNMKELELTESFDGE